MNDGDASARPLTLGPGARRLLLGVAMLASAAALGVALGILSWHFWVIGLFAVVAGVALGWVLAVLGLWLGLGVPASVTALALVLAWSALQGFDDLNHLRANRLSFAEHNASAATADLPPDARARIAASGVDFLAADADRRLAAEVESRVGFDGPVARWLYRAAEHGLRLAGGFRSGRALPVGVAGVLIAQLLELVAAFFIARRITGRALDSARASLNR